MTLTKRQLIDALEDLDVPDDTPVVTVDGPRCNYDSVLSPFISSAIAINTIEYQKFVDNSDLSYRQTPLVVTNEEDISDDEENDSGWQVYIVLDRA